MSWLDGSDIPTEEFQYRARDGRYYNGYMASWDYREDFQPMWDVVITRLYVQIEAELGNEPLNDSGSDDGDE